MNLIQNLGYQDRRPNIRQVPIQTLSQEFSDCGLRNDKSTKNSPCKNCGLRALVESVQNIDFTLYFFDQS